jgi:uncharacterized protein YcfL
MKAFLILLLAAAAGCVTRVETAAPPHPAAAQPAPRPQPVTDKRVAIDPVLANVIQVVGIKSTIGTEGYLRIQMNVQNLAGSPKQFSYRINWFDGEGQELPMANSAPLTWMLLSHETSLLAATAPTPAARDFRVFFLTN